MTLTCDTADPTPAHEHFVRLDDARSRDQGGTGLGLAIARDLAHQHRGTLTLTPRTLGACFRLRLPQALTPAERQRTAPQACKGKMR